MEIESPVYPVYQVRFNEAMYYIQLCMIDMESE